MTQIVAAPSKLYIGIDIHKKSWKVHFCTDLFDGTTKIFTPDPKSFKKYVDQHFADYELSCAYGAG